jgi:hypothetical protein
MSGTLQRALWHGQPSELGTLFRVSKTRGDAKFHAVCVLWTHQLGFEVRLEVNGDLQRSEVLRSQDDVFTASDQWHAAMRDKGWS